MRYQILVKFDNYNCTDEERKIYFLALGKYHALGIGHQKNQTSTMLIASNLPLDERTLAEDLRGLEILSIRIDSLKKTPNIN